MPIDSRKPPAGPAPRSWELGARPSTSLVRDLIEVNDEFANHVGQVLLVNRTDLRAMEHLMASGPLSPTDLAHRLGVTTAAATAVVDRLVALGHVARTPDGADRRRVVVSPSDASVRQARDAIVPLISRVDAVLDELPAEHQAIVEGYLRRVVQIYRDELS